MVLHVYHKAQKVPLYGSEEEPLRGWDLHSMLQENVARVHPMLHENKIISI